MTILNTTTVKVMTQHPFIAVIIFICFLLTAIYLASLIALGKDLSAQIKTIILLILFGFGLWKVLDPHSINRYEVIFDDSTKIEEVLKDYDLVEQRGLIYVIQEK